MAPLTRKPIDGPRLLLLAFAHRTIADYRLSVRHRFHAGHHDWHLQKPLQIRRYDVRTADQVIHSKFFAHVCEALHFPFTAEEILEEIEKRETTKGTDHVEMGRGDRDTDGPLRRPEPSEF